MQSRVQDRKRRRQIRVRDQAGSLASDDATATHFKEPHIPPCKLALCNDADFRQTVTDDTWGWMRQFLPTLKPWHWKDGIWSTNDRNQWSNEDCLFTPAWLSHLQRFGSFLVRCSHCGEKHDVVYTRHRATTVGMGLLPAGDWSRLNSGKSMPQIHLHSLTFNVQGIWRSHIFVVIILARTPFTLFTKITVQT